MTAEQKAIIAHFTYNPSNKIHSSFVLALSEARSSTGRDANGNIVNATKAGNWLGAIAYMTLLDQIGSCFKDKNKPVSTYRNTISKALDYFSSLSTAEIDVLYALRNAFAHDFSLSNIHTPNLTHCFRVTAHPSYPLITLPGTPWCGSYSNVNNSVQTTVNLKFFGDLVEGIVLDLLSLAQADDLEIVLSGGYQELTQRYMVYI